MRARLSSLFKETTEQSFGLRVLALATAWWAGVALGMVGAPVWIWAGVLALTTFGHVFSWRTRDRPLKLFRLMVVVTVLAISGVMALQLPSRWRWCRALPASTCARGRGSIRISSLGPRSSSW